jgi:hypothetical protein
MIYYVHSKGLPFGILSKVYYYVHGCGVAQSGLGRWTHNPEIEGSNPSPATKACDVRGKVFSGLVDVRGIEFLDVEGCVNHGSMLRNAFWRHGKSPCFCLGGF